MFLSFGYEKKLLAASTNTGVDIYKNFDDGSAELEQTLDEEEYIYTHEISKDGTYLVLGERYNVKVYMKDNYIKCNMLYCTKCLNSTHCGHCNELVDYFLNETTGNC